MLTCQTIDTLSSLDSHKLLVAAVLSVVTAGLWQFSGSPRQLGVAAMGDGPWGVPAALHDPGN